MFWYALDMQKPNFDLYSFLFLIVGSVKLTQSLSEKTSKASFLIIMKTLAETVGSYTFIFFLYL